jgi:endonuclease/exonuclease/phosphatase family metal-dependent hydrolase
VAKKRVHVLKLLQLNAWSARLDKQVINLIKSVDADIVCLQEIVELKGDSVLFATIDDLQKSGSYNGVFMSPVFSFQIMRRMANFGNAILCKKPFLTTKTIFTNLDFKENFDYDSDDYNIRNLQHATIEINGKKLNILNHHGHHVHQHKNGDAETMRQMKQIVNYIAGLEGPVILSGDFNLAPHSESLEHLNSKLANLPLKYGLKTTRTPLTHKSEVCDYIFVNDTVKVSGFIASDEVVSDHKALILEFDL